MLRISCDGTRQSADLQRAYIEVRSRDDGTGKYIPSVLAAVRPQSGDRDSALDRAGGRVLLFRLSLHGGTVGGAGRAGHARPADFFAGGHRVTEMDTARRGCRGEARGGPRQASRGPGGAARRAAAGDLSARLWGPRVG